MPSLRRRKLCSLRSPGPYYLVPSRSLLCLSRSSTWDSILRDVFTSRSAPLSVLQGCKGPIQESPRPEIPGNRCSPCTPDPEYVAKAVEQSRRRQDRSLLVPTLFTAILPITANILNRAPVMKVPHLSRTGFTAT